MYRNWRDLIKPREIEIDPRSHSETYAKFECEPLERGYGITVGNALRRILLSSIMGTAVTKIQAEGALHEFSKLDGVAEDTTQIMLNIREVALRAEDEAIADDEETVMRIQASGPGRIYAADIEVPAGLEIINPDLYIAELTADDAELDIEMWVETGVGYSLSDEKERGVYGVDVLPIDSVLGPPSF